MRRWSFIVVLAIITATAVWLGVHRHEAGLKRERAAAYQRWLGSYTDALRPGAIRKRVEDELRARGATYERVYGFDGTDAYADLVKIGSEPRPVVLQQEQYLHQVRVRCRRPDN